MSMSLSEIEALAKKAARGAGMAWGLAEDAGKAARWLEAFGLPGCDDLASYLSGTLGAGPISLDREWAADGPLCPIRSGACLADFANLLPKAQTLELRQVSHPLLILPFVGSAAVIAQRTLTVGWARTDGCCLDLRSFPGTPPLDIACTADADLGHAQEPGHRGSPKRDTLATLNALAARTYAPATEASRMLGAGAGNSDND